MKKSVKIDKTPDFRGFNFEEKKGDLINFDTEYIVKKEESSDQPSVEDSKFGVGSRFDHLTK